MEFFLYILPHAPSGVIEPIHCPLSAVNCLLSAVRSLLSTDYCPLPIVYWDSINAAVLVAIISDIHSNLEALSAVLREIDRLGAREIYCLGDIVGYGPRPHECIGIIRSRCRAVVRGNHDNGAVDRLPLERFTSDGAEALLYTQRITHPNHLRFLRHLPYVYQKDDITLVHASPYAPKRFRYVVNDRRVERAFQAFSTRVCFIGHTHIPFIFEEALEGSRRSIDVEVAARLMESTAELIPVVESEEVEEEEEAPEETTMIESNTRFPYHRRLIMVGSVGQPRDGNPRAAFGLYDTETGLYLPRRVEYDIQKTADDIVRVGLPKALAKRLTRGL